jgi:hypothetical protein
MTMKIPTISSTTIWATGIGAVAVMIVGFWGLGWTTARSAERMANDRAEAAVVTALVPFCVANAEHDADPAKLVKFKAEESSYSRSQLVADSGWATMPGTSEPDRALASACSDKLQGPKA